MKKTLLVLGAGATKDIFLMFPTGFELIKEINYHLNTELRYPIHKDEGPFLSPLMNELIRSVQNKNGQFIKKVIPHKYLEESKTQKFIELTKKLKTSLWDKVLDFEHWNPRLYRFSKKFISIDNFLYDNFKDDNAIQEIAKYAITYLLVGCENALKYKIDYYCESWIDNNWVNIFFENCSSYSLDEILSNITVHTFNYERTFEFFSEKYLMKHFGTFPKDKMEFFFNNKINHVYGKINELPFGQLKNDDTAEMKKLINKFNLMHFDMNDINWKPDEWFDQIFFIGFGYDEINLKKLRLDRIKCPLMKGTGKGISPERQNELLKAGIEINPNQTCKEFIAEQIL